MAPIDLRLVSLLRERARELTGPVDELLKLIDESNRVSEMLRVYETQPSPVGREADSSMSRLLLERNASTEREIEALVGSHAELDLVRRLIIFYEYEQGERSLAGDGMEKRRANQRLQAAQQVEWMRKRAEELAAGAGGEPIRAENKQPERTGAAGVARDSTRIIIRPRKASELADPQEESHGAQLAKATRDLLIARQMASIRFAELYRDYLSLAYPDMFSQSSETSRLELFRYHLSRAVEQNGLRYEGGRVWLDPAPDFGSGKEG